MEEIPSSNESFFSFSKREKVFTQKENLKLHSNLRRSSSFGEELAEESASLE
jgi:hypothetical protein